MTKENKKRKTIEELLPFWNNPDIDLSLLTPGSGKIYKWHHQSVCGCIHEWEKPLRNMYEASSYGCPKCSFTDAPCCESFGLAGDPIFKTIAHEWSSTIYPV